MRIGEKLESKKQLPLNSIKHSYDIFEVILEDIIILSESTIEDFIDVMFCDRRLFVSNNPYDSICIEICITIANENSRNVIERAYRMNIFFTETLEQYYFADRLHDYVEYLLLYKSPVESLAVDLKEEHIYNEEFLYVSISVECVNVNL